MKTRTLLVGGILIMALSVAGAYALSLYQIRNTQRVWCPALQLIVAHPPPARAPKSDRDLFAALVGVTRRSGC